MTAQELAKEIIAGRRQDGLPELKRFIVVYPAVGLHSDHDSVDAAEEAAERYRQQSNPSNNYGGPVSVVDTASID